VLINAFRLLGMRFAKVNTVFVRQTEVPMLISTVRIRVASDNRKEMIQTLMSLLGRTRQTKGFRCGHFYQDLEDEHVLTLVEEWETLRDLKSHLRSESFGVLLGAVNLLGQSREFAFSVVSHTAGAELVQSSRT